MTERPPILDPAQRAFVAAARRATLATIAPDGRPRLVPVCFVLTADDPPVIWTPLDEKPKRDADPRSLARVRDVLARPEVTLLVDRWDEDWARLAWIRLSGSAAPLEPGPGDHERAVMDLRAKYPQYANHALEVRPIIRIAIDRITAWGNLPG